MTTRIAIARLRKIRARFNKHPPPNGATAFLIVMATAFGLILPRMLFDRVLPAPR